MEENVTLELTIAENGKHFGEVINFVDFIKKHQMTDVFTSENLFLSKYGYDLYVYLRVSTKKQEFARQILELYEWAKKKGITLYIYNIFCDKFTGKSNDRLGYQNILNKAKENDYILVAELNRLGRDWDNIKKNWYYLEYSNINIIIMDNELLSAKLPNETCEERTLNDKYIQSMIFINVLYGGCLKLEEVSRTTKGGIKVARLEGKQIGKPKGEFTNEKNFIKTLSYQMEDNLTLDEALKKTNFPKSTYILWLKKYKEKFKEIGRAHV